MTHIDPRILSAAISAYERARLTPPDTLEHQIGAAVTAALAEADAIEGENRMAERAAFEESRRARFGHLYSDFDKGILGEPVPGVLQALRRAVAHHPVQRTLAEMLATQSPVQPLAGNPATTLPEHPGIAADRQEKGRHAGKVWWSDEGYYIAHEGHRQGYGPSIGRALQALAGQYTDGHWTVTGPASWNVTWSCTDPSCPICSPKA